MPRASKKRGHGSAGHAHKACVIFAIDELDSFVGRVVGIGDETRDKADRMLPFLKGCRVLVTDDKSFVFRHRFQMQKTGLPSLPANPVT